MAHKCETPAATGASRTSCGGCVFVPSTLNTLCEQHLIAHSVRADLAPIVAMLAFDGGAHG